MTATDTAPEALRPAVPRLRFLAWFAVAGHLLFGLTLVGGLSLIWALTTPGEAYWPVWLACVSGLLLAWHAGIAASVHGRPGAGDGIRLSRVATARVGLEIHAVVTLSIAVFLWAIWALTRHAGDGDNPPWPVWVTVPVLGALSVHATIVFLYMRSAGYAARIEQLTASRAGVLEAQELELRRIERDLHDGTQARLVALGMQLGLAEQQLRRDPARARELVADARSSTRAALVDLRDLVRGIYPPMLADRGLVAAIESLIATSPLDAVLEADLPSRLPAAVEGALYFTAAEAFANAAKHGESTKVLIQILRGDFDATLIVTDNGKGGANPAGSGLAGIRQRIEALDGRFSVSSPPGGPTIIRAELPCES